MSSSPNEPAGSYSRPEPPEWTRLIGVADEEIAATGANEPPVSAADALFDAVETTDNESLESARYYGLGLVICGVAKALHQPDVRQRVTALMAANFTDYWSGWGTKSDAGLHISDIDSSQLSMPLRGLVSRSYDSLSPQSKLVTNVLMIESHKRRTALEYPRQPSDGRPSQRGYHIVKVLNSESPPAVETVGREFTTAASTVLRVVLSKKHERSHGIPAIPEIDDEEGFPALKPSPALRDFITADELRQLDLDKVALRSAVLRLDEFRDGIHDFIDLDESGAPIFHKELMVPSRELAPPEINGEGINRVAILHEARLKCPAVFVAGAIPMTIGIIKEAIIRAQEQAEEQIAELARKEAARRADRESIRYSHHYLPSDYPPAGW